MPKKNVQALQFMLSRRSTSHKTLTHPVPDRDEVETILTAGARVPDHKMLEPFRFVVLQDAALSRLGAAVQGYGETTGIPQDKIDKAVFNFANAPFGIAVVASLKPNEAIPEVEQTLAVGACCLSVLNAALASGWGANWITGWAAFDHPFLQANMGLDTGEYVAGFIFIGTPKSEPSDRKRPDLDAITTWVET
ncbi:nitroreductase family protein [Neptunicoccus sediminis]|uniref:nitroreductase family protein n=1 Tax=Neptunicoccus sediminis TaxID=1892596 RepID=UPI000845D4EB|nr:nitroreductase [Neptunicoccus sediminis]